LTLIDIAKILGISFMGFVMMELSKFILKIGKFRTKTIEAAK